MSNIQVPVGQEVNYQTFRGWHERYHKIVRADAGWWQTGIADITCLDGKNMDTLLPSPSSLVNLPLLSH